MSNEPRVWPCECGCSLQTFNDWGTSNNGQCGECQHLRADLAKLATKVL